MRRRALLALAALAAGVALWFGAAPILRGLDFFRVRRIEVRGAQHLVPAEVAAALRLPAAASVFDDLAELARRVEAMPGVRGAEVGRRLPGTLLVTVDEEPPVALAAGGDALTMLGANGSVLPFDPTHSAPDLPIAFGADSALAGLLARLRTEDRGLYAQIGAARRRRHDIVLEVGGRRILVMPGASAEEIRVVMAVAQDAERTGRPFAELDGRFANQVVVRREES